jgi:hypothetical protein
LLKFLNEKPSSYLDEMAWFLWDEYEVAVSESSISRLLKSLHWSKKVVQTPPEIMRRALNKLALC